MVCVMILETYAKKRLSPFAVELSEYNKQVG
jgi:hypothetical protein